MTTVDALLPSLTRGPARPLDAVIVPARRTVGNLEAAVAIAAKAGCVLVALCDGDARAVDVGAVADVAGAVGWHAAEVPSHPGTPLLDFAEPPPWLPERGGRIATRYKRNIGLLVSRMLGWRTVLFLDDDIRGLDASDVLCAAASLHRAAAVGFAVQQWPDHSVVGSADRVSRPTEDSFVGGAALLIDPSSPLLGHFPGIHNADRLFLYDALLRRNVRCAPDPVHRTRPDLVAAVERARVEEFGEVIAEGLVSYARARCNGRVLPPFHRDFWQEVLDRRKKYLDDVARRLDALPLTPRRSAATEAVLRARYQHETVTVSNCVSYYQHWRRERRVWHERLAELPAVTSVGEALRTLGLEPARPPAEHICHIADEAQRTSISGLKYESRDADLLVLVVPGFLDNGSGPGAVTLAEAIQSRGHTAMTLDPRGTWRSGGTLTDLDPSVQIADVLAVVRSQPRYKRVALVGHSLGALVACLAAAQDDRITDVVAIMPPRCFVWAHDYDKGRDTWRGARRFAIAHGRASWEFRVPRSVVDEAIKLDLPSAIADMPPRVRMLFIAGTDDEVIPPASVNQLYQECASTDKEYLELPVGHDYRDSREHRKLVTDPVLWWLAEGTVVGWRGAPVRAAPAAPDRRAAAVHSA